jgi:aminoglycoside 3-N-acetyltransferase
MKLHLAEYRYTSDPPLRRYRCVTRYRGCREWRAFRNVVLDDSEFEEIGELLDKIVVRHHGYVGDAECRLLSIHEAVDFTTKWMRGRR